MPDNASFGWAVRALISNNCKQYLVLLRSASLQRFAGMWDLPGGKVDPGESLDEALCREVFEETGLRGTPVRAVDLDQGRVGNLNVVTLLMKVKTQPGKVRLSREHTEFRWVERDELPSIGICGLYLQSVIRFAEGKSPALRESAHDHTG